MVITIDTVNKTIQIKEDILYNDLINELYDLIGNSINDYTIKQTTEYIYNQPYYPIYTYGGTGDYQSDYMKQTCNCNDKKD